MDFAVALDHSTDLAAPGADVNQPCFHCGLPCADTSISLAEKSFCCAGCKTVFEILDAGGLQQFYELDRAPGVRPADEQGTDRFAFLNDAELRATLLEFTDGQHARVTFHAPTIHCAACVWLLENLFKLHPGIGRSEVNFPRRRVSIQFDETKLTLSELAHLLASLGYAPSLNLGTPEESSKDPVARGLLMRLGVAGFAAGNIMLLSVASYFGLSPASEGFIQRAFGGISLALALPVLLYSASGYWASAWRSIRGRVLTIDFPIALGIAALFLQSLWDIAMQQGEGYLDSFAGLVFLLLCGKWFQRKTYERLSFERDYKSYFPLAVLRKTATGETAVPVARLNVGDRVIIRHGEIIPADSVLISPAASVDYSFVTGESAPLARASGDYLYAGGRQRGGSIEVEIVKVVSQSYLTSLWNSAAFSKSDRPDIATLTHLAGRYFTYAILAIALGTALFWWLYDLSLLARAFCSVLLVACPCALALAGPYTLGSAMRALGRHGFYLRNTHVVEAMARADAVVFDKTGTLTSARSQEVAYQGVPLTDAERAAVVALARHSTHPISRAVAAGEVSDVAISDFEEVPGRGVQGRAEGRLFQLGSQRWLAARGDGAPSSYVAIDGDVRGRFVLKAAYRPAVRRVMESLARRFPLSIISGDGPGEANALEALCGEGVEAKFQQSPFDKLDHVRALQSRGHRVLMVGDGLNDAGALKQSDVGIALTEDVASFTPSCDAILDAQVFGNLPEYLAFSRAALRVLRVAFAISLTYNILAVSIAASGHLSPLISAILMPLSSFTVMGFSVGATHWVARRMGVEGR